MSHYTDTCDLATAAMLWSGGYEYFEMVAAGSIGTTPRPVTGEIRLLSDC